MLMLRNKLVPPLNFKGWSHLLHGELRGEGIQNETISSRNNFELLTTFKTNPKFVRTDVTMITPFYMKLEIKPCKMKMFRFSLLINRLINVWYRVDFQVSQRLGLWFYCFNSLMLFCSPLHAYFSTNEALVVSFGFHEVIGKIQIDFSLRVLDL